MIIYDPNPDHLHPDNHQHSYYLQPDNDHQSTSNRMMMIQISTIINISEHTVSISEHNQDHLHIDDHQHNNNHQRAINSTIIITNQHLMVFSEHTNRYQMANVIISQLNTDHHEINNYHHGSQSSSDSTGFPIQVFYLFTLARGCFTHLGLVDCMPSPLTWVVVSPAPVSRC